MTKAKAKTETNELAKGEQPSSKELTHGASEAPAFLKREKDQRLGTDHTSRYQTINRIAIVQSQSKKERRDEFGIGSYIMSPEGVRVSEPGEPFIAIPLFFWPTWEKWSDYNDDDSPTVIDTSLDENSNIAKRTKSKATRTEPYGAGFNYSYVESLNVAIMIDSGPAQGEIAIMSLNRSDHYIGRQIASMLEHSDTDIFARRIEFSTIDRSDGKNDWLGVRINNPTEEQGGVWIKEDQYESLKKLHIETKAAYDANIIVINRDEEPSGGSGQDQGGHGENDLPPV